MIPVNKIIDENGIEGWHTLTTKKNFKRFENNMINKYFFHWYLKVSIYMVLASIPVGSGLAIYHYINEASASIGHLTCEKKELIAIRGDRFIGSLDSYINDRNTFNIKMPIVKKKIIEDIFNVEGCICVKLLKEKSKEKVTFVYNVKYGYFYVLSVFIENNSTEPSLDCTL